MEHHTLDLLATEAGAEDGGTDMTGTTRRPWHTLTREERRQRANDERRQQRHNVTLERHRLQYLR